MGWLCRRVLLLETTAENEGAAKNGYGWADRGWGGTALAKMHPGSISDSFEGPALLELYFGKAKYRINVLRLLSQQCGVQESLTAKKPC